MSEPSPAGLVLAAGAGTRLAPLTRLRPKALCPVGGRPLLDLALDRLEPVTGPGIGRLAVNAHHHAGQVMAHVADHLGGRAAVNVEQGRALGTAGAIGALRSWLDGRPVLVTNADAYLPEGPTLLARLASGWDGSRCRLLCVPARGGVRADFEGADVAGGAPRALRFAGASLVPAALAAGLAPTPSGLYEVLWRDRAARGELEFVVAETVFRDCGTVGDYLAANLHASGGLPVVGQGAVVRGRLVRSVVWDGAYVGPDEELVDAVRAGTPSAPVTVVAAEGAPQSDMS